MVHRAGLPMSESFQDLEAGFGSQPPFSQPMDWPSSEVVLQQANRLIPQLHLPGAMTVGRDRWERLVTAVEVPEAPERVWRALTDPDELRLWLAVCRGALDRSGEECILDFEDGEFFLVRPTTVEPPHRLRYLCRWVGLGQASSVTWDIEEIDSGSRITVTEEAFNPPWDWQTWNGDGWPGILDQLAAYLRTGTEWRWVWRRMGPYAQVELPVSVYEAWDRIVSPAGLKYWLQTMSGQLGHGQSLTVLMGDASGIMEMMVQRLVEPGQAPPSFLPSIDFTMKRQSWEGSLGGRLWIEPSGWGRSLFQMLLFNWENMPPQTQLSERKILTGFLVGAARRVIRLCGGGRPAPSVPSWSDHSAAPPALDGAPALPAMDPMKIQAFMGRALNDMSGAMTSFMCILGDRLGLFRDLATSGPSTPAELAERAGIHAGYAADWLSALACAGYLEFSPSNGRFTLPPEHAAALAFEGQPMFLGGAFQQLLGLVEPFEQLVEASRNGQGVPQSRYGKNLLDGMERVSANWFDHQLVGQWLQSMPDTVAKLERGALVADVGCGSGRAVIKMAETYPSSRFHGYDISEEALQRARAAAESRGVADRVSFEKRSVIDGLDRQFDLIATFNSLHDFTEPLAALKAIKGALLPTGSYLMLEINSSEKLEKNIGPTGAILYGTSVLYSTPVSLANGGEGKGALAFPETEVRRICREAGFGQVRRLVEDPFNVVYAIKP